MFNPLCFAQTCAAEKCSYFKSSLKQSLLKCLTSFLRGSSKKKQQRFERNRRREEGFLRNSIPRGALLSSDSLSTNHRCPELGANGDAARGAWWRRRLWKRIKQREPGLSNITHAHWRHVHGVNALLSTDYCSLVLWIIPAPLTDNFTLLGELFHSTWLWKKSLGPAPLKTSKFKGFFLNLYAR